MKNHEISIYFDKKILGKNKESYILKIISINYTVFKSRLLKSSIFMLSNTLLLLRISKEIARPPILARCCMKYMLVDRTVEFRKVGRIRLWNSLPKDIRDIQIVGLFKN